MLRFFNNFDQADLEKFNEDIAFWDSTLGLDELKYWAWPLPVGSVENDGKDVFVFEAIFQEGIVFPMLNRRENLRRQGLRRFRKRWTQCHKGNGNWSEVVLFNVYTSRNFWANFCKRQLSTISGWPRLLLRQWSWKGGMALSPRRWWNFPSGFPYLVALADLKPVLDFDMTDWRGSSFTCHLPLRLYDFTGSWLHLLANGQQPFYEWTGRFGWMDGWTCLDEWTERLGWMDGRMHWMKWMKLLKWANGMDGMMGDDWWMGNGECLGYWWVRRASSIICFDRGMLNDEWNNKWINKQMGRMAKVKNTFIIQDFGTPTQSVQRYFCRYVEHTCYLEHTAQVPQHRL